MTNPPTDINAIFAAALEQGSAEQRAKYLDQTCGQNTELRARVEALLQAHHDAGSFLEKPAIGCVPTAADAESADDSVHEPNQEPFSLDFLAPSHKPGVLGEIGQYEITEVVGRGGMGIVLKGFDPKLSRVVAIKVLAPELASNASARKRFLREGQAAAAISHDHVVTIYGINDNGPLPFIAMGYISGESLQQRIDQRGALERTEILRIGKQAAAGLAAAHAEGLIHRDVKPGNILLENGVERVKITDFGLARAVDDVRITQPGVVTGTPEYMSPEQAHSEPVDHRSDLFSLGCVLYAMCTGRPPFRADSTAAVIHRLCADTPRPIPEINSDVPDWLCAIIDRLLAKDPDDRFQSASEVAELLGQCLAHVQQPAAVPMPPLPERPTASSRRHVPLPRRAWVAAAAGMLVLLGGLGFTEATGLTDVAGTVIRIVRGDGTLVIEVDDPAVSVSIDGDELVITGAGAKEIRLPAGQYEVEAVKGGKPVYTELVTVTRGGRQVVRVTREGGVTVEEKAKPVGVVLRKLDVPRSQYAVDLSPDGTKLAFTSKGAGITVRELSSGEDRSFEQASDGWYPVFAPNGKRIAYQSWKNFAEQEIRILDIDSGEVKKTGVLGIPKDWSPDGKWVLYVAGNLVDKNEGIRLLNMEDHSTRAVYSHSSSLATIGGSPDLSPDGKWVVFSEKRDGNADVYVVLADGGDAVRITDDSAIDRDPLWSPDGEYILFRTNRQLGRWDLWAVRFGDGKPAGKPFLVRANPGEGTSLYRWSQSGRLVFDTRQFIRHVYSMKFDPHTSTPQGTPKQLTHSLNENWEPTWSPDGKRIAFLSKGDASEVPARLMIMSADGTDQREVARIGMFIGTFGWLPDNDHIVCASPGRTLSGSGIYSVSISTGEIKPIYLDPEVLGHVSCSPDGKRVAFLRGAKRMQIHTVNVDGTNLKQITTVGEKTVVYYPRFSPDGKQIVYTQMRRGDHYRRSIMAIPVDGGEPREVYGTDNPKDGQFYTISSWLPDGRMTFEHQHHSHSVRAVPLDGNQEPETIFDDNGWNFRVSPTGETVVFQKSTGNQELWLMENFFSPPETDVAQASREPSDRQPQPPLSSGPAVRRVWDTAVEAAGFTGAISPDGRYFAYVNWTTCNLELYEFASGQKRVLDKGSWEPYEAAFSAVFSPDAQQVAYCWMKDNQFELRAVGLDGTKPRVLSHGPSMELKEWSPDGKQIVAKLGDNTSAKEIAFISVADGTRRVVKKIDSRLDRGTSMSLSPDGRYLAYSLAQEPGSGKRDVFLLALDGGSETRVVRHPADDFVLGWSPDGRDLVFASDRNGPVGVWVLRVANGKPEGEPQVVKLQMGSFSPLGLSRDGSLFYGIYSGWAAVYSAELDPQTGEVLQKPQRVFREHEGANYSATDWSRDGRSLVALSSRQGNVLCIDDVQTGKVRIVRPKLKSLSFHHLRWSPDGRWVLGRGRDASGQPGLLQIDMQTGDVTRLQPRGWEAEWAPDGTSIFWTTNTGRHLARRSLASEESVPLYFDPERTDRGPLFKRLDKNGDGKLTANELPASFRDRLLRADADSDGAVTFEEYTNFRDERAGQAPRTPYVGPAKPWTLSRDGEQLAFATSGALYVLSVADGKLRKVAEANDVRTIAWTPDGQFLLYATVGEETNQLWRVAVADGKPQKLDIAMPHLGSLRVHPDGRRIAFFAQAQPERSEVWVLEHFLPRFIADE